MARQATHKRLNLQSINREAQVSILSEHSNRSIGGAKKTAPKGTIAASELIQPPPCYALEKHETSLATKKQLGEVAGFAG